MKYDLTPHLTQKWQESPFFCKDALTLGLDIGIEGIGITLRKGQKFLYSKTLLVELPKASALEDRRVLRGARRARKNRKHRMHMLKKLFIKHGLPWLGEDISSRTDPFLLRYRALNSKLASLEALSLCIRSVVQRRGFDYQAMNEGSVGEWPWGAEPKLKEALKWLKTSYIDAELAQYLRECRTHFLKDNGEQITPTEEQSWLDAIAQGEQQSKLRSIPEMLARYKTDKLYTRKARTHNYPRNHVAQHLKEIIQRHSDMIPQCDEFLQALFMPCDTKENKQKAIFYYNRKTPQEAQEHFQRKVKKCPYCLMLKRPQEICGQSKDPAIIMWKILDFLSNRNFDFTDKSKAEQRRTLPATGIESIVRSLQSKLPWGEAKKALDNSIKPLSFKSSTKSEWNKEMTNQLKDIYAPKGNARASMSTSAASELCALITEDYHIFEPHALEAWKKDFQLYEKRAQIELTGGIYPQVRTLLGTLASQGKAQFGTFATKGFLQKLFEHELAEHLDGKTCPDYCVVECIKNAAMNSKQALEIQKQQQENRKRKEKLLAKYNIKPEDANRSKIYRLYLFEEQLDHESGEAICPFTGQKLGSDPLAAHLELAHLYPDSRGGLYVAENLVLTTKSINQEMNNRTPIEASEQKLNLWLSTSEMLERSKAFKWGQRKRYFFAFRPTAEESFPDFNNSTRIAQLARELRRMVAHWMNIAGDAAAQRERIGNPSGIYTAAARATMLPEGFVKDRSQHLHHSIDAAVLSCIPPGAGINDISYGGIFKTVKDERNNRRLRCLNTLPLPDFKTLLTEQQQSCPVIKLRSRSKFKSLGDSTFWSVSPDGLTHQRTNMDLKAKELTLGGLETLLNKMRIPQEYMPSRSQIEKWIVDSTPATVEKEGTTKEKAVTLKPLRLKGGAEIRSIHKSGGKGHLNNSPLGWSGIIRENGKFDQMRKLDGVNDRLELWRAWSSKLVKGKPEGWKYSKRVIPTKNALLGLKRLGIPWRGRKNAPQYLLDLLDGKLSPKAKKYPDLKSMLCGVLPPHAQRVGIFRKGDVFSLTFAIDEKKSASNKTSLEDKKTQIETWGAVSAIKSDMSLEIKSITHKNTKPLAIKSPDKLAKMLGLPKAEDIAPPEL